MNIFLPTIQNTGTWFLVEFLKNNPGTDAFLEIRFLEWLTGNTSISNIPPVNEEPHPDQKYIKGKVNILHSHISTASVGSNQLSNRLFIAMCVSIPTVIPLRDPLLSILTMRERCRKRNMNKDHKEPMPITQREEIRVDTFIKFVKLFNGIDKLADIFYFPIDITIEETDRFNLLFDLTEYCRIGGTLDYLEKEAREWKPQNTRGNYKEKELYMRRDKKYFEENSTGFKLLKDNQKILRPFFERFGYKNLLWWD